MFGGYDLSQLMGGGGNNGAWVMVPNDAWGPGAHQVGKGGGKGGGKGKKRKEAGPPPPPLDAGMVAKLKQFLMENGGTVSLGRITTVFAGVKKPQVEEHFNVFTSDPKSSDYTVSLSGVVPPTGRVPPSLLKKTTANKTVPDAPKKKREKKQRDPNAPPPPELEPSVISEIHDFLEANGHSLPLGKLTTKFDGLKKAQLEGHFSIVFGEKDSIICIAGFEPDPVAAAVEAVAAATEDGPAKKKRKKEREPKDPNKPPPPALKQAKVMEIRGWLEALGGSAPLGRVTTVFSGVKKAQLETVFVVTKPEGNFDPIVSTA